MDDDMKKKWHQAILDAPVNVEKLIEDWGTIDDELREHYSEEIDWMLDFGEEYAEELPANEALDIREALKEVSGMWDKFCHSTGE